MIDVYWPTPNGHRITVLPEEASLEYKITTINIRECDQSVPIIQSRSPQALLGQCCIRGKIKGRSAKLVE